MRLALFRMPKPLTAPLLVALALATTAAHAQTPERGDEAGPASADELFSEGREAMREGDFVRACPKFAESQRLDPSLGTLLNLGLCEEQLGDLVSALAHLRAFVEQAPSGDDRLAAASEQLTSLDRRVPRIDLRLAPDASPLTQITIDGAPLTPPIGGALSVPLNPGHHELVAQAPGGPPLRQPLRLDEGSVLAYVVRPAPAALAPDLRRAEPAANTPRTLGFVGLGVGAAGLTTSFVFGGLLLDRKSFIDQHCDDKRCDDKGLDAVEQAKTLSVAGTTSFVVGLVGLAAGVYLLATSPKSLAPRSAPTARGGGFAYTF